MHATFSFSPFATFQSLYDGAIAKITSHSISPTQPVKMFSISTTCSMQHDDFSLTDGSITFVMSMNPMLMLLADDKIQL